MSQIDLQELGLSERFAQETALYDGLFPARVSGQHRDIYRVIGENGELQARAAGKLAYQAAANTDYPVVGDWVMIDRTRDDKGEAVIHHILKRKSVFERKAAGTTQQAQIIAANIDVVFICMALNNDFNLRRLERYLTIAWDSMATPVVILTKADICDSPAQRLAEVGTVAAGIDILVTSSTDLTGYQEISRYLAKGKTIAFVGSSGVGKSTLINCLLGKDVLATKETRRDDKGRHTTTHRQLILLPSGGIVLDTPGMRELQLNTADLSKSFEDIEALAAKCKFRNCTHTTEPHCAVRQEIENGRLLPERLESYQKLKKEISYSGLDSRQLEQAKIRNMFGGLGAMKQAMDQVKNRKY